MTMTRRLFNGLVLGFAISFGFLGQRRFDVEQPQPLKAPDHNLYTHVQTVLPDGTSEWTTNEDFMSGLWFDDGRQDTYWQKKLQERRDWEKKLEEWSLRQKQNSGEEFLERALAGDFGEVVKAQVAQRKLRT